MLNDIHNNYNTAPLQKNQGRLLHGKSGHGRMVFYANKLEQSPDTESCSLSEMDGTVCHLPSP